MPTLDPTLRDRLNRPVPSARCSGARVAKVTVLSGTNKNPSPAPWMNPVTAIVHCETFGFQPVIEDRLRHAHAVARSNAGAAGVDGVSFARIEAQGVEAWLASL